MKTATFVDNPPISRSSLAAVAAKAKVSRSTVSRVLSGFSSVSAKTRERTLAVIEELGYEPDKKLSQFFRYLHSGSTKTVAFLNSGAQQGGLDFEHGFFGRHLIPIQQELLKNGYHLLLADARQELQMVGRLRCVAEGKVDGVIAEAIDQPTLKSLSQVVPFVLFNHEVEVAGVDMVVANYERAAREEVGYLVQAGHRAVACFRPRPGRWDDQRFWHGYERACAESGLALPSSYLEAIHFGFGEDGRTVAQFLNRLMDCERPPTAILTYDRYAGELIRQLAQRGLAVPRDVSIVGVNDFPWGQPCPVPLTTYREDFEAMARIAVRILLERFNEPKQPSRLVQVDGELIVRQSSGQCAHPRQPEGDKHEGESAAR